jgi:hypothetical protein
MLLKELYSRRALNEVKKMKEIVDEDMSRIYTTLAPRVDSSGHSSFVLGVFLYDT